MVRTAAEAACEFAAACEAACRALGQAALAFATALDALLAAQPVPAESVPPPPQSRHFRMLVRSPERDALLREEWPKGTHARDILPRFNALPGQLVTQVRLAQLAAEIGVKRPAGFNPWNHGLKEAADSPRKVRSEARDAVIRREWPKGTPNAEILATLNALPGRKMTARQANDVAKALGVRRPDAAPAANVPAPSSEMPTSRRRTVTDSTIITPARRTLLREEWPKGTDSATVLARFNDLPGRKIDPRRLAILAHANGCRRPAGYRAACALARSAAKAPPMAQAEPTRPVRRSEARDAVIAREWPLGTPTADILTAVNALPGRALTSTDIGEIAKELKVHRPAPSKHTSARVALVRRHWPTEKTPEALLALVNMQHGEPLSLEDMQALAASLNLSRPEKPKPALAQPKGPPKIAPFVPSIGVAAPSLRIPTPSEKRRIEEARAVAEFAAKKGVTRCPPACAAVTTHVPTKEEAAAMRAINDAREAARQAEIAAMVQRMKSNRAAKLRGKPQADRQAARA